MAGDQNLYLILLLAGVAGTAAGNWFAAEAWGAMAWLMLVIAASCAVSAMVVLLLLPLSIGLHWTWVCDAVLALFTGMGANRSWPRLLDRIISG